MNTVDQRDIHMCKEHKGPSSFSLKKVKGRKYPLCQYEAPTWFNPNITVYCAVSDEIAGVTCGLCQLLEGKHAIG
jgi:hypothetical protein